MNGAAAEDPRQRLADLFRERLIPEFCGDPREGFSPPLLRGDPARIDPVDARDFMRHLHQGTEDLLGYARVA